MKQPFNYYVTVMILSSVVNKWISVCFCVYLDLSSELVGRLLTRDQLRTEQDAMLLEVQDMTSLWCTIQKSISSKEHNDGTFVYKTVRKLPELIDFTVKSYSTPSSLQKTFKVFIVFHSSFFMTLLRHRWGFKTAVYILTIVRSNR